jgi:hypothetical protein
MASITIKYTDLTTVTVPGTNVPLVAVAGGEYQHNGKAVDKLAFVLGTSAAGTVTVTPSGATMPPQTCFSGAAPSLGLPFTADWNMASATQGVLTLTIPTTGTSTYPARLEVVNGGNVDISVKH